MPEIIKETGIFVVIAQALLYFVPGEAYVKYVKVLIGIILILQIAGPFLQLADADMTENLIQDGMLLFQEADESYKEVAKALPYQGICEEIGPEIKEILSKEAENGYLPKEVNFIQKKEDFFLEITVEKWQVRGEENLMSLEELAAYYGDILGMKKENISVFIE